VSAKGKRESREGKGERGKGKGSPQSGTRHPPPIRVAVLTVSDLGAAGKRADTSGDAIVAWAKARGFEVTARDVVPDESDRIAGALLAWADDGEADLVLTTGGTGLAARDVTPEATRAVLERDAPGIAEAIRSAGRKRMPHASLSRGLAGVRSAALIVNLPGSTGGVKDALSVLDGLVEHAVALLRGEPTDHS
jgi:molybdenum cofactor synthesis domain-containing protein